MMKPPPPHALPPPHPPHVPHVPKLPQPCTSAPKAVAPPTAPTTAADAMKMALRRRVSVKLVAQREEVLSLVHHISDIVLVDTAAAVAALRAIESRADELGLPLSGEAWGLRLAIPKKAGGHHFDQAEQLAATASFRRAGAMLTAVSWHEQLTGCASQCAASVSLFRGSSGRGASLSKAQMLKRCTELLTRLLKTRTEIFDDAGYAQATAEMVSLRVPQCLAQDASALDESALLLAAFTAEQAAAELAGLRAERMLTRKFRAPQTLSVLTAAAQLIREAHAAVRTSTASVDASQLQFLLDAIAEVEPLCGGGASAASDELDDAI